MRKRGRFFILLGLLLIVAALVIVGNNMLEEQRAKRSASRAVSILEDLLPAEPAGTSTDQPSPSNHSGQVILPDYKINRNMQMPVESIEGNDFIGILRIPVLNLELPIISQWSYPDLKIAPCRYTGSAYLDNMILCGHNYTSHFHTLKMLQPGDAVYFTDMDGNHFHYEVALLEILDGTAVEEMESGDWDLTLFVCTLSGKGRITVRCVKAENTGHK